MSWYDPWSEIAAAMGVDIPMPDQPLPMLKCHKCDVLEERGDGTAECWSCGGKMRPCRHPAWSGQAQGPRP